MTQNIPLARGDVAIEPFFDATQEVLGAAAPSFYIAVVNKTTLKATAGTGNDLNAIVIGGKYRWRTASVEAAHPGGAAGTYYVWVTASDNEFTAPPTEDKTVYTWGLSILESGKEPGTALKRKVGEVDWDGAAITSLRHLTGVRRDGDALFARPPIKELTPLKVRAAAGQTADLVSVEDSTGAPLFIVDADGDVAASLPAGVVAATDTVAIPPTEWVDLKASLTITPRVASKLLVTAHVSANDAKLGSNIKFSLSVDGGAELTRYGYVFCPPVAEEKVAQPATGSQSWEVGLTAAEHTIALRGTADAEWAIWAQSRKDGTCFSYLLLGA